MVCVLFCHIWKDARCDDANIIFFIEFSKTLVFFWLLCRLVFLLATLCQKMVPTDSAGYRIMFSDDKSDSTMEERGEILW